MIEENYTSEDDSVCSRDWKDRAKEDNPPSNLGGDVTRTLTEQIIELMPEENHPHTYSSENADIYDAYSRGFNKCRTEMINKIPEILSLIEKKLMRGFDELENNDIDKSMEQWKNYKFIRNNIRDILK